MLPLIEARDRLRRLADECEERARWAPVGSYERGALNHWAAEARKVATNRNYDESDLRIAHRLTSAVVGVVAGHAAAAVPTICPSGYSQADCERRCPMPSPTAQAHGPWPRAPQLLNARQLANLVDMSERGALKRITHAFHRGLPGFYRDGRRWFAEREAFEQFRMSSDWSGSDSALS
jgi:hypothetical protein